MKLFYKWIPKQQQDKNTKNSQDSKYLLSSILSLQYIYYLHHTILS